MTRLPDRVELLTDLYEITMAAGYFAEGRDSTATFSLFIRNYPPGRSYFVAAGIEDFLEYAADFHFSETDLAYLESTGLFLNDFLDYLRGMRFTGNIHALAEGEIFFADEPILEVTAPIIEAQILETLTINSINLPSMIALKASRCVHAASGRGLVDFSLRRTHGFDAGLKVARSSYIAGFSATSNVLAGKLYGIPITGTMAHSFVSSFSDEIEAFRAFARLFPEKAVFLIDTYDTVAGAQKAAIVGREMEGRGGRLSGVRLDSGDFVHLSREVRRILDEAGLNDTKIFASGDFDEYKIARTIDEGACIDAFGVGTKMGVSADAPYLDMVYKLVRYGDRPIVKLSTGKVNLAGEKQVFRRTDREGRFVEDIIATRGENIEGASPLLAAVMEDGELLREHPSLEEIRERFAANFAALPDRYKALDAAHSYPVKLSTRLKAMQAAASRRA